MRNSLVCLIILCSLFSTGSFALLKIDQPQDKTLTNQDLLTLTGSGDNLKTVNVNEISLDVDDEGKFTCGLWLNPGKNYIVVKAWDGAGKYYEKGMRVLRLVSFPDAEITYEDKKHWARHEILTLASLKIAEGYPDGNFYLSQPITRGEFATWLVKAKGVQITPGYQDVFFDVPKEHWRAPFIKAACQKGWMKPVSANTFGVDDTLTRGEAADIAFKAEGGKFKKEIPSLFYDVPENNPYYVEIKKAKQSGLIKGISRTAFVFQPNREITRAECAILFSRFARVKWLEKWLFDFRQGYNTEAYCKINTPPLVDWVTADPASFSIFDENPGISLNAMIVDRQGLDDILSVKADISDLGGPPDAEMRDDGTYGDEKKGDGIYTLRFVATTEVYGEKTVTITATDKAGSTGTGQVGVTVVR
ncbi:MAG TPA: S-layer homology domain-containing protein [Candidatus Omnitrophota bacterium]|nr:S-layer homology domain-containing protein [Candidatus Omnitrophota bacterium]